MKGELHLVCEPGREGRGRLIEQRFRAPMHLSKPYWEDRLLIANIVNSTAGLFDGDTIGTHVEICAGGEMLLTNPSANRVFRSRGGVAAVDQTIRVAAGGWLEFTPAILIPHAGSRYRQRTRVEVEEGGGLLWIESFAPGRVASGEAWAFASMENDFELRLAGRLIAKERYTLRPGEAAVTLLTRHFPTAYCASIYVIGAEMPPADLHASDCWSGCTRIGPGACAARVVAAGSLQLSRALAGFRELAHRAFNRQPARVRRM